jgi:hypothetical protein
LSQAKSKGLRIACLNNLRQIGVLFQIYTDDHEDIFPPHRNTNHSEGDTTMDLYDWWGTTLVGHIGDPNYTNQLFHCPALNGPIKTFTVTWSWSFDVNHVGYGYNGYFLGHHPYPLDNPPLTLVGPGNVTHVFSDTETFKRSQVLHPSDCLEIGDKNPTPANQWASSLWFPNAYMDPAGNPRAATAALRNTSRKLVSSALASRCKPLLSPAGMTQEIVVALSCSLTTKAEPRHPNCQPRRRTDRANRRWLRRLVRRLDCLS